MVRLLVVGCMSVMLASSADFEKAFETDYRDALKWVQNHQVLIREAFEGDREAAQILLPVLFPEAVRYSLFRDFFETQSLELVYVNLGADYADFSIGRFQMKPSFAEQVEGYLREHEELVSLSSCLPVYSDNNPVSIRRQRLRRLQNPALQMAYARAFYQVLCHRFPHLSEMEYPDRIRFVAAAYNAGFLKPEAQIRAAMGARSFPYGPNYPGQQYIYSEVALDFFIRHGDVLDFLK